MLKLKAYRNKDKDKELVRFITPGTYVNGENFAEATARGLFEKVKKAWSRDQFYLATAIATMIALEGTNHARLFYGEVGNEYAAWVEVEFQGETYVIDLVEFRDIAIPKSTLKDKNIRVKWSCDYDEIKIRPETHEIVEAMTVVESSKNVIPVIAATYILD